MHWRTFVQVASQRSPSRGISPRAMDYAEPTADAVPHPNTETAGHCSMVVSETGPHCVTVTTEPARWRHGVKVR